MCDNAPKQIVLIENNLLDRAVIDMYMSDLPLRYSEKGKTYRYDQKFIRKKIQDHSWDPDNTVILVDLGLSKEGEDMMAAKGTSEALSKDRAICTFLRLHCGEGNFEDLMENLAKKSPKVSNIIRKVAGFETLLFIKHANPLILCGVVSHYVDANITDFIKVVCLHGSPQLQGSYADRLKGAIVAANMSDLRSIKKTVLEAWEKWQILRPGFQSALRIHENVAVHVI